MTKITKISTVLALTAAMAAPSSAFAADPGDTVYNPNNEVLDVVSGGTPTPTPPSQPAPAPTQAPASDVQDQTDTPSAAQTPAPATETPSQQTEKASSGSLPFTGFEAGFVGIAGLALLGGGFAMRRMSRDES